MKKLMGGSRTSFTTLFLDFWLNVGMTSCSCGVSNRSSMLIFSKKLKGAKARDLGPLSLRFFLIFG